MLLTKRSDDAAAAGDVAICAQHSHAASRF